MSQPEPTLRAAIAAEFQRLDAHEWGYDHGFTADPDADPETASFVDAALAVVQRLLDAKDAEIARLTKERDGHQSGREQLRAISRDHRAERDRAMAGVPLVCSDDRHQAKVRGLEAEIQGLEETAAEQQQNALRWQERAEGADRLLDQASAEVERLNTELAGWQLHYDPPPRAVDSTADISDYEEQPWL